MLGQARQYGPKKALVALTLLWFVAFESTVAGIVGRCARHVTPSKTYAGPVPTTIERWSPPPKETVLGDFDNARLTHFGVTSSFYRENDDCMVRTEGPDGNLQAYKVKYTLGAEPLQQYLVAFPVGRLQALSLAWDSREC